MDARLLLGVLPDAGRTEIDAAARRLAAKLDPTVPGATELRRLVQAARDVLNGRGSAAALSIDPHRILGLRATDPHQVNAANARTAFRRLARLTHPDNGGTDELFRVVEAACELVLHPFTRTHTPPWERPHRGPPGPPPPPGPFVARPASARTHPSKSIAALVVGGGLAVAATVVAAGIVLIHTIGGLHALPVLAVASGLGVALLVSGSAPFLRSVVVLVGTRVRAGSPADPDRFLEACCLDSPVGREHEDVLYRAYERWCASERAAPIAPWRFVEHLRSLGLLYVRSSAWETGVWVGVRRRKD